MLKEMHFFVDIYSSVESTQNKTVSVTKYKELKDDLASALDKIKRSEELNRKREQEFQETLAAMQRRIVELEGRIRFLLFLYDSQGSKRNSHCFWI